MKIIQQTKNWITSFVVQLNLCPFAAYPFNNNTIKYVVYEGQDLIELIDLLEKELIFLTKKPVSEVETTLIIHPELLNDFYDYIDFLDIVNQRIFALDLEGVLQIASFHPDYQFGGTEKEDVTNYTNRSPYPMLHLLREDSIEVALESYENPAEIPERNMETMARLGKAKLVEMLKDC